jgi:hypothetical protein
MVVARSFPRAGPIGKATVGHLDVDCKAGSVASRRLLICFTPEQLSTLSLAAVRFASLRHIRRAGMQLILSFLERSPPPKTHDIKIDPEARAGAIKILARIIAQAYRSNNTKADDQ